LWCTVISKEQSLELYKVNSYIFFISLINSYEEVPLSAIASGILPGNVYERGKEAFSSHHALTTLRGQSPFQSLPLISRIYYHNATKCSQQTQNMNSEWMVPIQSGIYQRERKRSQSWLVGAKWTRLVNLAKNAHVNKILGETKLGKQAGRRFHSLCILRNAGSQEYSVWAGTGWLRFPKSLIGPAGCPGNRSSSPPLLDSDVAKSTNVHK
jgi:hypothetical protein